MYIDGDRLPEERRVEYIEYEYKGKVKRFKLVTCDKQIGWVSEAIEQPDGRFKPKERIQGMNLEEIKAYFPRSEAEVKPRAKKKRRKKAKAGYDYTLMDLFRAIIYEAFRDGTAESGNVRHFWYTHIKKIVDDILEIGETDSVKTTLNTAWGDMIVSGTVTYEDMGIFSAKEKIMHAVVRDSPFANLIVAAEKENLFEDFKWIPKLFNNALITAGGQPSRANARAFIRKLKANNVDLDQQFYMLVISDLDPAGYYIQRSFQQQLEKAIEYYGGTGKIKIRRLFVRKDQLTPEFIETEAMRCEDVKAKDPKAVKAFWTKWEYFCSVTDGGLYKEEGGKRYPAKIELDSFGTDTIERRILLELLKIIEETSDESLIMIPEVMRIFDKQRVAAIEDIFNQHRDDWLQPLIDAFLSETEDLEGELDSTTRTERIEARRDYDDTIEPIEQKYERRREKVDDNIDGKVEDQGQEIEDYKEERGFDVTLDWIEQMREMLNELEEHIDDEVRDYCSDNYEEIKRLEGIRDKVKVHLDQKEEGEIEPHKKAYDEVLDDIKERDRYRTEELEKYRRWKGTLFNPVEKDLQRRIERPMSMEELDIWYRNLEGDLRTQPHIVLLMSHPELLLEKEISAWDQDEIPVFKEKDLLQKASKARDENVEAHRRGFTSDFLDAMKSIALEKGEGVEVEYPDTPEFEDISKELEDLHDRIEKDIEEDKHKPEEEED